MEKEQSIAEMLEELNGGEAMLLGQRRSYAEILKELDKAQEEWHLFILENMPKP